MSAQFTLYLLGQKGHDVLTHLVSRDLTPHLAAIVYDTDDGVDNDYSTEIQTLAASLGLPVHHRKNAPALAEHLFAFAVGWRHLIVCGPRQLVVLHDSLLPRYRGFNPLVSCLINGEPEIGVTALYADKEYDAGDIIAQARTAVSYPIKVADAINLLSPLYAGIVADVITHTITTGTLPEATPQRPEDASFSLWRDADDYLLDWHQSAERLARTINAVSSPYAGAATRINGQPCRIVSATAVPDVTIENRHPGKVIFLRDGIPTVVCGTGLLEVTEAVYENGESALPLGKLRSRFA